MITKVGIYSGSFDPVHLGHIEFAEQSINQIGLNKVFFLPEPMPRRKQGVKAFEHRIEMLKLALNSKDNLGLILLEQPKFTAEKTLPLLIHRFSGAELFMLIGDDMLDHFVDWPNLEKLLSNLKFIIAVRKYDTQHIKSVISVIEQTTGKKITYEIIDEKLKKLSSKQIKANIKKHQNFDGLNKQVSEYIKKEGLYSVGEK